MDHNVLIIDDDKIIRKITSQIVQICKLSLLDPIGFPNGLEALNYLSLKENRQCEFILFLDINMPVMDGWTFLERLEKEKLMQGKVIYLITSSVNKEDYQKALANENVQNIITKPLTVQKIKKLFVVS
jgi:CheY-like chemotaxis protein